MVWLNGVAVLCFYLLADALCSLQELDTMWGHVDALQQHLRVAVHELEMSQVRAIKGKIRVKRIQALYTQELDRCQIESTRRLKEAEQASLTIEADARALIRNLSQQLTESREQLTLERVEQQAMRRELLASHQLLNESMTAEGLQLVEPAVIFRPKLIVTAQDSGSASSSVRLTVSCEPTSIRTPEPSTQLQGGSETHGLEMSRALQASQVADQLLADLQEPVELPPQPTPVSPSPEPQPQPEPELEPGPMPVGPPGPEWNGDIPVGPPDGDAVVVAIGPGGMSRLTIQSYREKLNSGSGWFRAQSAGARLVVEGLEPQCVKLAIRFLEGRQVELQDTLQCGGVLLAAEQLKIPALRMLGVKFMEEQLGA